MTEADPLRAELRRLARLLQGRGVRLIVGGGYGLLLRTEYVRRAGLRTRFQEVPGARATNDLDIFLSTEIITDAESTKAIRSVLDELGYKPVEKYYQFARPIEHAAFPRGIKVDLLAAPVEGEEVAKVEVRSIRIKPRGSHGLHARRTWEALTVEEQLLLYDIGEGGEGGPLLVYLPHPYTYIALKLFALRDRLDDELKGPYHAFDIYRVIAMMTEEEWEQSVELRDRYKESAVLAVAREIAGELFAGPESEGVRLLRAHARSVREDVPDESAQEFIADLHELLRG
jgi:hypothetical protein